MWIFWLVRYFTMYLGNREVAIESSHSLNSCLSNVEHTAWKSNVENILCFRKQIFFSIYQILSKGNKSQNQPSTVHLVQCKIKYVFRCLRLFPSITDARVISAFSRLWRHFPRFLSLFLIRSNTFVVNKKKKKRERKRKLFTFLATICF